MFKVWRKKIQSILNLKENTFKHESIKICFMYLIFGFIWIYFSDRIVNEFINDSYRVLIINTYKGLLYVIVTSTILYLLIINLLEKVYSSEKKLNESYEELLKVNDKLESYVKKLTDSREKLRIQYNQIIESEKKLSESEHKNRTIIKSIPDLLFVVDDKGYFVDCMGNNDNFLLMSKKDFIGKSIWEIFPNNLSELAYKKMKLVLKYGTVQSFEYKLDISKKELYFEIRMIKNNEREILAISRNVTLKKQNELKIKMNEEKYKTLISEMQQGLVLFEGSDNEKEKVINYKLVDANASYEKLMGLKKEYILGKTFYDMFPNMKENLIKKIENVAITGQSIKYQRYIQEKNKYYEVVIYRPKKFQFAAILTDITERKQMENKLEYLSYNDQLTGLYNRRYFERQLTKLDVKENLPLTIVMADVNGLKLVNDSFGHVAGDELLKKVGQVIKKGCRDNDIIARLGGDEFVILLPKTGTCETEEIMKNIKKIALQEAVGVIDISVSLGYGTKKNQEEKIEEILKKAEDYMYKKKLFEGPSMRGKIIKAIISTLHEKNKREEEHSHRVSNLCYHMGKNLGLPEGEIEELKTIGLLHDIGKIAIEDNILNKPGKLTNEEWKEIKRHPEIGYRILSTVNDMLEISEYTLYHHERWDGKGYPKGLKGQEIPLQSRIITIIDAYDAMTSKRSYRNALSEEVAIEELKLNAGIQFDPDLTRIFVQKVLKK
ncbi:diguanylate cyclase [Clostridium botulinum]|nr:diguanylate cyclase [Clostridium botulinum]